MNNTIHLCIERSLNFCKNCDKNFFFFFFFFFFFKKGLILHYDNFIRNSGDAHHFTLDVLLPIIWRGAAKSPTELALWERVYFSAATKSVSTLDSPLQPIPLRQRKQPNQGLRRLGFHSILSPSRYDTDASHYLLCFMDDYLLKK